MSTQTPVEPAPGSEATPAPPERRPSTAPTLLGAVLVVAGALWLLAALGVDLPVTLVAPIVLIVLGLAVVITAVRGEEHPALGLAVFVGVWLSAFAILAAVTTVPLTGAVGDVELAPATAAELEDGYRLFAGTQRLDLRDIELEPGTTEVALSTVLGELEVWVPEGMAVRVEAGVAAGSIDLDDVVVDGVALDRVETTEGWDAAERRLDLELRVGLGQVRLRTG